MPREISQGFDNFNFTSDHYGEDDCLSHTKVLYKGKYQFTMHGEQVLQFVAEWFRGSSISYGIREFDENDLLKFKEKYDI